MENMMGEYAVIPRGLEEFAQRLLFAIVLASPDTLIFLDRHWLVPRESSISNTQLGMERESTNV